MKQNQSEIDQLMASLRDFIPAGWRAVYNGCLAQGFDEVQAFQLLQTYILSQAPEGIQPPNGQGPDAPD